MHLLPVSLRALLLSSFLLLGLPGHYSLLPTVAGQSRPSPPNQVYTHVEQMPELYEGGGEAAIIVAVQEGVVLPLGTPVPAAGSAVVVRFVVGTIGNAGASIVRGISPAVDKAVLDAVRRLPLLRPGKQGGKFVPVALTLTIPAPGAATPAQHAEARTRWQQTAQRRPGEADSTFLRRVLPLSYPVNSPRLIAYAWRPSAFGKQLFFTLRGDATNDGGTDLYILDPFQPDTYAVQVLRLESMGDLTDLASLFFFDTNGDGKKELLALVTCSLKDRVQNEDGEWLDGHWPHYRTDIWQYKALSRTDRPRYAQESSRSDLDELSTAAEVRQALARPQRRAATQKCPCASNPRCSGVNNLPQPPERRRRQMPAKHYLLRACRTRSGVVPVQVRKAR